MRRFARFPLLVFSITNGLYLGYENLPSDDVLIISVFLLFMGYLFCKVKEELIYKAPLLFIIGFASAFFTAITLIYLEAIAFLFIAILSFVSGFFGYALGEDW